MHVSVLSLITMRMIQVFCLKNIVNLLTVLVYHPFVDLFVMVAVEHPSPAVLDVDVSAFTIIEQDKEDTVDNKT